MSPRVHILRKHGTSIKMKKSALAQHCFPKTTDFIWILPAFLSPCPIQHHTRHLHPLAICNCPYSVLIFHGLDAFEKYSRAFGKMADVFS